MSITEIMKNRQKSLSTKTTECIDSDKGEVRGRKTPPKIGHYPACGCTLMQLLFRYKAFTFMMRKMLDLFDYNEIVLEMKAFQFLDGSFGCDFYHFSKRIKLIKNLTKVVEICLDLQILLVILQ